MRIHTFKVFVTYPSIVFGREVCGKVIGKVFSSILPVRAELILLDAEAHPVERRVKVLGALPVHVAGKDAVGGCAVGFDRVGRLRVAHLDVGHADGNRLLAVE